MGKDKLIRKKKREKTKNSHNYDDNKITRKYKRLKRKAAKMECLGAFLFRH